MLAALWGLTGDVGAPLPVCVADGSAAAADLNCDGMPNVVDVQMVIELALTGGLDPAVDADGDGCPDACGP